MHQEKSSCVQTRDEEEPRDDEWAEDTTTQKPSVDMSRQTSWMKLYGGLLAPPREPCSKMHITVSIWMLPHMTSHLCLLILSSLAVSSQLGLEDVFFSPRDQTVREGQAVFFQCVSGESSPPASIVWFKDGKVVTRGRQIQGEYGGGRQKKTSGSLHLFNVTLEDDGIYICVTHNPSLNSSKTSKPAKLTVQAVPRRLQIIQGPDNITVAMGTEVSMHCAVRGFPVPMVHWFKNGCLLSNCSSSFILKNNGQLLTFRNVTKEDEGSYHCEASNQEETITSQPGFLLPAEMDWSFVQQPRNQTVQSGDSVTVSCRPPFSRPAAHVSWFKNNQLLVPTADVTVLQSGDLFFQQIKETDSGSYFCRASNIHLQRFVTSRRATLTVLAPPSVKLWPQLLTVPVGARVLLECQVSGHPLPSISWMKRGHSKQTGGKVTLGLRNATLHIQAARSYDEGVYICEASNTLGQSRGTAMLRVAVSPIIVTFSGQVSSRVGASVVLICKAVGILPITYIWTRGGTQSSISPTEDRYIQEDGALHILNVKRSDGGEYHCTAENRAGRHQRRTILTVTAEDHPGEQTRLGLSASINMSRENPVFQPRNTTDHPHEQEQNKEASCFSSNCDASTNRATTFSTFSRGAVAGLKMSLASLGRHSRNPTFKPTDNPTQQFVTQIPPMLPPPPRPNFPSGDNNIQLPVTSEEPVTHRSFEVLGTTVQYLHTESQSPLELTPSHSQFQHHVSDESLTNNDSTIPATSLTSQTIESVTDTSVTRPMFNPVDGNSGFLKLDPDLFAPDQSLETQTMMDDSGSVSHIIKSPKRPTPTQISQTKLENPSTAHPQRSFTLSFLPKFHLELSTIKDHLPATQPSPSPVTTLQTPQVHNQHPTTKQTSVISTLPQIQPHSYPTQHSVPTTIRPQDQTSDPSTLDPEIPVDRGANVSDPDQVQLDVTQRGDAVQSNKSVNDTEFTELLKRNTSQSPMTSNDPRVTQQSPSWLPVLEKHDIPIVVGVGVSLAFIFITVTFYSVVQKNEPAPTSRAAQRNLGVPLRHAERLAAGRTYENRAFEDDDCVAVVEQSPNTSDTRARPPGPSLVTVQMEPTFEDLQDDTQATVDNHLVTVETYPEPILDTKIDPSSDEEKGCSLSQPSVQLQCEDWTSNRGDDHSPCQDALPPPSSLPSCSPSPSPPSRREEGLRSSLTLHSSEQCVPPIHHSLSISHGNSPLLLSHHVSLGLTTVAVDVHFYPSATASMAVGSSTHVNSVSNTTSVTAPLYSPSVVNSRENDQSDARFHQSK